MKHTQQQAYRLMVIFQNDAEKVLSLFYNFKEDYEKMTLSEVKSQSRKILLNLNKLDIEEAKTFPEYQKGSPVYEDIKKEIEEILDEIEKAKDFLYSLEKKEEKEEEVEKIEGRSIKKSKVEQIRHKFAFLQRGIDTMEIEAAIQDAKNLEKEVSRLDFAELPEGEYDEMLSIRNELARLIKSFQGIEKSERYGPYLQGPLSELIQDVIIKTGKKEQADSKAATILDFIEDPERIEMFEPAMKRIIAKKMTPKEFRLFYQSVKSMMHNMRKNESFESFQSYKERYV